MNPDLFRFPFACLLCQDLRWIPNGRGQAIPCPDCQPEAAVLALKRGHRR